MRTLSDLAKELNRQPWAVVKMLKNRGYLKKNGEPKKRTLISGYMTKRKLITNSGWDAFIKELGKKYADGVKPIKNIVPEFYILTNSNTPLCALKFRYGNASVSDWSKDEYVVDSDCKYLRNKGEENRLTELLSSLGFVRQNGKFRYKGKASFLTVAEKLLEGGFELFDTNEKPVKSSKSFSCNVSYGIDWFNVSLSHEGTELSSFVYDNINLKSKFFEFNGEKYLIPKAIENHKDAIKIKDGSLVIQKDDLLSALELSSELQKNDIANFENLFKDDSKIELTEAQKKILRPYQIAGVNFLERLKSNGFGALLADDMGLGKTLQAITFLSQTERKTCAFVVVPKSLLENWRNEVEKFAPNLKVLIYHGANRKENQAFENYDIILSTYATTMLDIDFLSAKKFSAVVFDEVQTIKNYKSKMYEAAFKLNADFKMALSGTPFENNVLELWSVMRLLNPKIFANRGFFTRAVATEQFDRIKKAIAPFMLQRKKKDVLKDLPEKTEEAIFCTMDETMSSCYSALHAKIIEQINGIEGKSSFFTASLILESLMKLRQFCCHPSLLPKGTLPIKLESSAKFDVLKIKVQALVEQKEKVIIFSQFTSMLKIIKDWLETERIKTFYLDGATNNRQDLVDEFEKSEDGVFLISLKAGGVGLNLVSCHYMFIYDPWWNPASESQAADRIYRIGQKSNVFIYRLITKNTIEEKVLSLQQKKSEIAKNIFDGLAAEKLTAEDLTALLG
ncbi:MAG: DEAD/DEAH box helicase [Treponema sp.]|nr:DEAD/DEAH box helicase [Treponema sp.]